LIKKLEHELGLQIFEKVDTEFDKLFLYFILVKAANILIHISKEPSKNI
jgi:hypothetical protein